MPTIDIARLKRDMRIVPDDDIFLEMLFQESNRSVSKTRKQSALLVKDGVVISTGHFDGYLSKDTSQVKESEEKNIETGSGAVENVIASCARLGISSSGATLYTWTFPNAIACKLVVKAGISEIRYVKSSDNPLGMNLCKESNMKLTQIKRSS